MDVIWYGHSCFRITERGQPSVVTDPYSPDTLGGTAPKLKGEIVTVSHDAPGHNYVEAVKGSPFVVAGPGEYEIGGVFIVGIALHLITENHSRPNVAYLIDYNNLTVLHLGDLAHVPDQSTVEALGAVNVVLVPVGGGHGLNASAAAEVVALLEPDYIVPMHYALPDARLQLDPVDKFLKAMGVSKVQEDDALKVTATHLPEQPQVVLLRPQVELI